MFNSNYRKLSKNWRSKTVTSTTFECARMMLLMFWYLSLDQCTHYMIVFSLHQEISLTTNSLLFNTLRPRQNGKHFPDDISKSIFMTENVWILNIIWLNFVPKGPIDNNTTLLQIVAWCWSDDKPLSNQWWLRLLTHICITLIQWVKSLVYDSFSYVLISVEYDISMD